MLENKALLGLSVVLFVSIWVNVAQAIKRRREAGRAIPIDRLPIGIYIVQAKSLDKDVYILLPADRFGRYDRLSSPICVQSYNFEPAPVGSCFTMKRTSFKVEPFTPSPI